MHVTDTDTAAIVTGAASGLGAATAAELVSRGAHVYGLDLPAAVETPPSPGNHPRPVDVTDPDQVQSAVDQVAGPEPLRAVVNCASIGRSMRILGRKGLTIWPSTPRSSRST